ncbi:MAG: hypothetical protein K2K02_00260 [Ruminococcus sp.]|nr:hypothetical protein [Ruminococcus sp.]
MKASKRRNYLKRTLAFISALSIIGSFSQPIAQPVGMITSFAEEKTNTDSGQGQGNNSENSNASYSRIKVDISNQCDFENAIDCKVKVTRYTENNSYEDVKLSVVKDSDSSKEATVNEQTITLEGKNASGVIQTEHLVNGDYYVEVSAKGFQTFKQKVTVVDNMVYTVKTTLDFHRDYVYTDVLKEDSDGNPTYNEDENPIKEKVHVVNHPGVLKIGDVNGDGKLDSRDSELLLAAVDYAVRNNGEVNVELNEGEILISDLNYDGKTSLADLTMFTKNYFDTLGWNTEAYITSEVSEEYLAHVAESVEVKPADDTVIKQEASFAELLTNSGNSEEENKLKLGPKEGGDIGINNPVEISWNIGEGVEMKTLNIDTNAAIGEIIIETDEGNKTESFSKKTTEESGESTTEVSVESSTEEPVESSTEEPVESSTEESIESSTEVSVENPTEESIESPTEVSSDVLNGFVVKDKNDTSDDISTLSEDTYEEEEHSENEIVIPFGSGLAYGESEATATNDDKGISVDLGEKIAIKKITIKITKVKNTNLAEIAKVEILNGMEERMEEPPIAYPVDVKVEQLQAEDIYASIKATWKMEEYSGITGYEYEVSTSSATRPDGSFASPLSGLTNSNTKSTTFTLASEHGNFKLIKTNTTYYVHVRATNDTGYKSAWSDSARITTKSLSRPEKPDYVKAVGGFQSISVSWGGDKTNSTQSYDVYYRKAGKDANGNAYPENCIEDVKGQSCLIVEYNGSKLEDETEYEVYVKAKNLYYNHSDGQWYKGVSPASDVKVGETIVEVMPKLPKYNAINFNKDGDTTTNIDSITRNGGEITGNEKDNGIEQTAWAVVDGDGTTYYQKNANKDNDGITVTFKEECEIGSIGVTSLFNKTNFDSNKITIWESGKSTPIVANNVKSKEETDAKGKKYRIIELPKSMQGKKIKKIQVAFNSSGNNGPIVMSELCFYAPDTLKQEIMELFTDELKLDIKADVTQGDIDYFRYAVRDAVDPISGETHPDKTYLLTVIDTIEGILQNKKSSRVMEIHSGITTAYNNATRNFDGLNALQPIGAVAGKETEIIVYVGCRMDDGTLKIDRQTYNYPSELTLVHTQYNSESNGMETTRQKLYYGENKVTLNKGETLGDAESGGSLYIEYCGARVSKDHNFVRVSGVDLIPMLDIYGVTDINERYERAAKYIEELDAYVKNIETLHNEKHVGAKKKNGTKNSCLDRDYKEATCILGATEILDDRMMYSLPAVQIHAGLGKGTVAERAVKLITSMDAMENMIDFFYQHKGISPDAKDDRHRTPDRHLNIRYQRMFANAFMYAAGNHIGIPYGSASGMVNCNGVKSDENGKYISGNYFGWGIAHEIGHCLNDST